MYSNVQRGWLGLDNGILTSAINPPGVEVSANIMGVGARPLCHYIRHTQGCENLNMTKQQKKISIAKGIFFQNDWKWIGFNILINIFFWFRPSLRGLLPLMADGMCHKCEYLGINGHESWHWTIGQYFTTWHLHLTKINCQPTLDFRWVKHLFHHIKLFNFTYFYAFLEIIL